MTGPIFDIPSYSVPKEAFESQKPRNLGLSGRLANNSRVSQDGGDGGARGKPVAVFTIEEFKKGVNIGTNGNQGAASQATQSQESLGGEGQGLRLDGTDAGKVSGLAEGLPEGAYGRRYRPLDNGKMADASQRLRGLSEEQKISKLKQIKESAEEYEGFLIAEMIKNMRQSPFVKTAGNDTYSEIAEKPFTAALTQAGGLGLAQTIVNQVADQEGLGDVLSSHPEVMGPNWRQRLAPSQMHKPGPKIGDGRAQGSSEAGATNFDSTPGQAIEAGLNTETGESNLGASPGQAIETGL
ncbi:MAG: hypothetical protein LBU69_02605 [Deltaproteobacteria bacterium]|jgi:Rod binding domain-containing protein|nr:hypothetical protein [Deltaproteobacteria bacterium]